MATSRPSSESARFRCARSRVARPSQCSARGRPTMQARHILAINLLVLVAAALVPACAATMDSTPPDTDELTANMTSGRVTVTEPTGEAAQELQFCECSIESDWCILKGKICRPGV